jgi:SAM-dependent methyltransferase
MQPIALEQVASILARHTDHYRNRPPAYQHVMLNDFADIWQGRAGRLLDVGGGTGVIAEAIQRLLPVDKVETIDVVDRFFNGLSVATHVYDGETLPFEDASFDAATINNVMHHIPIDVRPRVMAEIRRVVSGPVYIKDHVARTALDHLKLIALDAIGNIPFGGMIKANYLSMPEWHELAGNAGYEIAESRCGTYRRGAMAALFPNRLEAVFRLERI